MTSQNVDTVMAAVLSEAVALAGLLLVFIGFVYGTVVSDPKSDPHYRLLGLLALIPFFASLVVAAAATAYWLYPDLGYAHAVLFASLVVLALTGAIGLLSAIIL